MQFTRADLYSVRSLKGVRLVVNASGSVGTVLRLNPKAGYSALPDASRNIVLN